MGIFNDIVEDVSDTVDEAVDTGQEVVEEVSEGAGDVVEEVGQGDLGGAVEDAQDTVEDVTSPGESDSQDLSDAPGATDTDNDGSPDASIPDTGGGFSSGSSDANDSGFDGDSDTGSSSSTSVGGVSTPSGPEIVKPSGETVEDLSGVSTPEGEKIVTEDNETVENPASGLQQAVQSSRQEKKIQQQKQVNQLRQLQRKNRVDRQDARDIDFINDDPTPQSGFLESIPERRKSTEKAFEEKPEALANLFEVGSDLQGFETAEDVAFRQADSLEEQKNISEIDRLSVDEQVRNRVDQLVAAGIITEEEEDLVEATATSASVEKKADALSENFVFQELGDLIASGESFFVDSTQSQNQFLDEQGLGVDVGPEDPPKLNESFRVDNASIESLPEPPANATSPENVDGLQDINVTERGDTRAENLAGLVLDPAQFVTSGRQFEAGLERTLEGQTEGDLTEEAVAAGTVGSTVLAKQISRDPLGFAIEEGIGPGLAVKKGGSFDPGRIASNAKDSATPSLARQDPAFQAPEDAGSKGKTGDGRELEGTSSFQPEGTQDAAGRLVGSEKELEKMQGLGSERSAKEAVQLENNFEDQSTSLTDIVLGGDRLPEDPAARAEILNPENIEAVNPVSFTLEGGTETVQGRLNRLEALREEFGPAEDRQADMFRELRRQEAREEPGLSERTIDVLTNTRKGQAELVLEEKPGDVDKGDTVDTQKLVGRDDRRQDVNDRAVDFTERDGVDSRGRSRDSPVESVNNRIDAGVETIGFAGIDTDTDLGVDQGQGQGLDQDQGIEPEQPFDVDNRQEPGSAGAGGVDNVFRNFEERVNETFQRGRSEESRGRRKGGFPGLEIDLELGGGRSFDDFGGSESPQAAPSVDAILFGDTTEEEVKDEKVFTGVETREVEETFDFNLF